MSYGCNEKGHINRYSPNKSSGNEHGSVENRDKPQATNNP